MKVTKLNGKHALNHKWKFALIFGTTNRDNKNRYKYAKMFEKMYGPDRKRNPDYTMLGKTPMFLFNANWYNDQYRGRIYFNQESAMTMISLMGT